MYMLAARIRRAITPVASAPACRRGLLASQRHIRLLEEAELVTTEKVGRVRRCMLAPYAFEGISTWLQRLDRFAQVVERTKGDR
jgi:hypothetical protein